MLFWKKGRKKTAPAAQAEKNGKRQKRKRSRRHIPASMSVPEFFDKANEKGLRYLVLRWFDQLPEVDGDIDFLVHDEDFAGLTDMTTRSRRSRISCDIFSVAGTTGGRYLRMPYYPPHLAKRILDSRVHHKDRYPVPGPWEHLMSFVYHAVYHKERKGAQKRPAAHPERPSQ